MSRTVENLIVLTWLQLTNPPLPQLVKQRYGTELSSKIGFHKTEIFQALPSLLEGIRNNEDARSFCTFAQTHHCRGSLAQHPQQQQSRSRPLCKQATRSSAYFLSRCRFVPECDRKYLARARQIQGIIDTDSDFEDTEETHIFESTVSLVSNRVSIRQSPYLESFISTPIYA